MVDSWKKVLQAWPLKKKRIEQNRANAIIGSYPFKVWESVEDNASPFQSEILHNEMNYPSVTLHNWNMHDWMQNVISFWNAFAGVAAFFFNLQFNMPASFLVEKLAQN